MLVSHLYPEVVSVAAKSLNVPVVLILFSGAEDLVLCFVYELLLNDLTVLDDADRPTQNLGLPLAVQYERLAAHGVVCLAPARNVDMRA